jgi:predicted dehydrogenase
MGFMGTTHLRAAAGLRGARVAAIVTTDPRKARGDFRGVRGNFGGEGGDISLAGVRVHADLDSLLGDDEVDLVDICLPSYLHTKAAIQSLEAGKHVLVEKPIALRPRDGARMIAAARRARRLLMVAQVLKFFPEFALLADAVRDRRWGRLLALQLRRIISMPDWGGDSWFARPEKSGGMVVDLHIHDTDFLRYLFGTPRAVSSSGLIRKGRVDFIRTAYELDGAPRRRERSPLLAAEAGWINAPALSFEHGYDAFFERATCHYDSTRCAKPVLFGAKGREEIDLPAGDGFQKEIQAAADAVRRGKAPASLDAGAALASLRVCLAEERSARTSRRVEVSHPRIPR